MNEDLNLVIGKSINVKASILVIQATILDDYFTDYRWRQAFFRVDDNGLVQSVEQTPRGRRYNISTKQWKENRNHALPKFGKIAKPHLVCSKCGKLKRKRV